MNRKQRRASANRREYVKDGVNLAARIPEHLATGLAHHRAGRLTQAEGEYRRILQLNPSHIDALHFLGVLAHQKGRNHTAVELISRAIGLNDQVPSFHTNISLALLGIGHENGARSHCNLAICLDPTLAEAYNNLGVIFRALDQPSEARTQFERAIVISPRYSQAHDNLANLLRDQGEMALGANDYHSAPPPNFANAYCTLANTLQQQGRIQEAVAAYRSALISRPDYADAFRGLGDTCLRHGKLDEALAEYARALAIKPDYATVQNNVGVVFYEQGKFSQAVEMYRQVLALNPKSAETLYNAGNALTAQGSLNKAIIHYQRAVAINPSYAEAHNNLGNALLRQGAFDDAVTHLREAMSFNADYPEIHNNLGNALFKLNRLEEARLCYIQALALRPDDPTPHCNLGNVLRGQGKLDAAIVQYQRALLINPEYADALNNLGGTLRDLGRLEEAQFAYERAIQLAPNKPMLYLSFAPSKRFVPGDPHLAALERIASSGSLTDEDWIHLHFALAKAYEDVGERERSFRHLLQGNALMRRRTSYDEAAVLSQLEQTKRVFTREFMRANQDQGYPSSVPVFIVGMPRSGTTLIEQILASHPKVFGAGELMTFAEGVAESCEATSYPDAVLSMRQRDFQEFGRKYVYNVGQLAPSADRITDKMPGNFLYAGLVHLVLPNAKIVHIRRDPVDTCLSCFSKLFAGNQPFAYDLAELGRFYRGYRALMDQWRRVLPHDVMLEVQYEDVVGDVANESRRIVAHCGLEWDDACLSFYETERTVRTASATQVRQPIYSASIGRWRLYEPFLQPLLQALNEPGIKVHV